MSWIPLAEATPHVGCLVLLFGADGDDESYYIVGYRDAGGWVQWDATRLNHIEFTHWARLSAPE